MPWPIRADAAPFKKHAGAARTSSSVVTTTLTASASINTYGTYVSLGTTPSDRRTHGLLMWVTVTGSTGTDTNMCVTLRTVSGSGTIIVSDFYIGSQLQLMAYYLPITVLPNTAIYGAVKCGTGSRTAGVGLDFCTSGEWVNAPGGFSRITCYGNVNSGGTQVTAHASANTYTTTPVELTASTTYPMRGFMFFHTPTPGTTTAESCLWSLMRGGAGSEVEFADRTATTATTETVINRWPGGLWQACDIPSSTRLSTRLACSTGGKIHGAMLYGLS